MNTTTPALDVRDHTAAIRALIEPGMSTIRGTVGDYSQIPGGNWQPGTVPREYALISVGRRYFPGQRLTGQAGRSSWRASVRWVGSSADNALKVQWVITDALDETRLALTGRTSTLLRLESSSDAPEFDEGFYSGLTVFTYTV